MKSRYIIYIIIGIICVVAIVAGVYYQVFVDKPARPVVTNEEIQNPVIDEDIDLEEIRKEFNELFDNTFDDQGYDTSSITKIPGLENEEVIYSVYTFSDKGAKYNVNINLPQFNVNGEVAARFNGTTQEIANKVGDVLFKSENNTVYNVEYVGYLNENILSLVIRTTLKEENNPQKVEVRTYNYNIETGEELSLNDVLEIMKKDKREVNKQIDSTIKKAAKEAEDLAIAAAQSGQTVYQRNPDEAMYVTDHVTNFFVGLDGQIYIVYAYGNEANLYTAEMDVIKVK